MTTVTYNIPNINCGHCVHTIKMEVGDLDGVQSVDASSESNSTTIVFDAPATEQGIKDLLAEINYPAAG